MWDSQSDRDSHVLIGTYRGVVMFDRDLYDSNCLTRTCGIEGFDRDMTGTCGVVIFDGDMWGSNA